MSEKKISLASLLHTLEVVGNRLPNPTMLFIWLCGFVLLISAIAQLLQLSALHPISGELITAKNLLSKEGLHLILQNTVNNFVSFAPVGTVLVAILGIGIAEHSGLIGCSLKAATRNAPASALSCVVVFLGVLSSIAADTGYVVLLPLAGILFAAAGRHPVVGIGAAFAGVSGGFSANLLIGPIDAIISGISTEAAAIVSSHEVSPAGNYYFLIVSTFVVTIIGTWVTEKIVSPRFAENSFTALNNNLDDHKLEHITPAQRKGLILVGIWTLAVTATLLVGLMPEQGFLRSNTGGVLKSPFISGLVTIIAVYAAVAGVIFGRVSGSYQQQSDIVIGMEKSIQTMAGYIVLMFFAAQFISYFNWSQIGIITAISGANVLQALNLPPLLLLMCFIFFTAFINLFVGSASAKWALLAPIFIPMLYLNGISPEATQLAFRIGDSSTNIITPLMPYFGVAVVFIQRYLPSAGMGTLMALMLPYSMALLVGWSLLMLIWGLLGWPLGPGAELLLSHQ